MKRITSSSLTILLSFIFSLAMYAAEETRITAADQELMFAVYTRDEPNEYFRTLVYAVEDRKFKLRGDILGMTKTDWFLLRKGDALVVKNCISESRNHLILVGTQNPAFLRELLMCLHVECPVWLKQPSKLMRLLDPTAQFLRGSEYRALSSEDSLNNI